LEEKHKKRKRKFKAIQSRGNLMGQEEKQERKLGLGPRIQKEGVGNQSKQNPFKTKAKTQKETTTREERGKRRKSGGKKTEGPRIELKVVKMPVGGGGEQAEWVNRKEVRHLQMPGREVVPRDVKREEKRKENRGRTCLVKMGSKGVYEPKDSELIRKNTKVHPPSLEINNQIARTRDVKIKTKKGGQTDPAGSYNMERNL